MKHKHKFQGLRTRVVAEATLVVDKDKVWKDWARKIGKFGKGASAVGGALVVGGLIVDAVQVIDEGGKVNKKPNLNDSCGNSNCQSSPLSISVIILIIVLVKKLFFSCCCYNAF